MARIIIAFAMFLGFGLIQPSYAANQNEMCRRPAAGKEVTPPPDLYSSNGSLNVALNYETRVDENGLTLFCFQTPEGLESPTLHVNPGDTINISLTNMLAGVPGGPAEIVSRGGTVCGNSTMTATSVNMHFHGLNVSPHCHSDEVIRTLVNSGQTFVYKIKIPANEPPGLYWYHPHIHGMSSIDVQGGATGAIVVEGIEKIQPIVAGLPQRLLIVRDQPLPYNPNKDSMAPYWDLSLNYVPLLYPKYVPSVIKMQTGSKEFWRVANASANSILDLQVKYDGQAQQVQVVGFDGVPVGSQDGKGLGYTLNRRDLLIPPAGRVEFVIQAPGSGVKVAELVTNAIKSGPQGDFLPARRISVIKTVSAPVHLSYIPVPKAPPHQQRFEDLDHAKVTAERKLFFDEVYFNARQTPPDGPKTPDSDKHMLFFITVDGQRNQVYDPNNAPAIVTNKGAVEDWTIENHTQELHEFHIHQIHFKLLEVNGVPVPKRERQFYDTYQVPFWKGGDNPYPSIKVRMDFRGAVVGNFVYHCHILDHEDLGMMAIIQLLPKGTPVKAPHKVQSAGRVTRAVSAG